ncbi:MAG TPA: MFS transporter [Dehalococcoidales bacterium]|nr:MFS transporter [Dehalococcoidales bacterium]
MKILQTARNRISPPTFGRGIWAVAAMYVAGNAGFATAYAYLSLYFYRERHMPMTLVGLIFLVNGIIGSASNIIGGITGDRFGYRKMISIYISAALFAAAGQAVLISMKAPVWSIVLLTIIARVLGSMAGPSFNAIIANISPKNRLTESYSLLAIAVSVGWAIGPLLGGWLLGLVSFGWLIALGAGMQAMQLIGLAFLPADAEKDKSERPAISLKSLLDNKALIIFSLLNVLFFLTTAQWGSTLSVFTVDRIGFSTKQYGLLLSISSVMVIIFQFAVSKRIQAGNMRRVLVLACLIYAAGFLSFGWVRAFAPAIITVIIIVTAEMLFMPTALSIVGRISRPEDRGKSMGIYGLCQGLGFSLGPLLGGFLLDKYPASPLYVWGPISLCPLIAAIGFALWRAKEQSNEDTSKINQQT